MSDRTNNLTTLCSNLDVFDFICSGQKAPLCMCAFNPQLYLRNVYLINVVEIMCKCFVLFVRKSGNHRSLRRSSAYFLPYLPRSEHSVLPVRAPSLRKRSAQHFLLHRQQSFAAARVWSVLPSHAAKTRNKGKTA